MEEKQSYYDKALTVYGTITDYEIKRSPEECLDLLNTAWELCERGKIQAGPIEQKYYLDLENEISTKISSIESKLK